MTAAPDLVVAKIGGSLLTEKSRKRPTFRRAAATRLLGECGTRVRLALVHGAGSFGHPAALRHRFGSRMLAGDALDAALRETQAGVGSLRRHILEAGEKVGLRLRAVPAPDVVRVRRSRPELDPAPFQDGLAAGWVPITGGDAIPDPKTGARIVSGDTLVELLAKRFEPARVVFATDVDGLIVEGELAEELSVKEATPFLPHITPGTDATGGMRGKLEASLRIAARGISVLIVNGNVAGRFADALAGRPVTGTRIHGPSVHAGEGPRPARSPRTRRV